jgi:hypothetical protein
MRPTCSTHGDQEKTWAPTKMVAKYALFLAQVTLATQITTTMALRSEGHQPRASLNVRTRA